MPKTNTDKKLRINDSEESYKMADLPKITSSLLPSGYELLPNTSELFELEFALKIIVKFEGE